MRDGDLAQHPRNEAEARKLNAEASQTEWHTLRDEIDRLTETVTTQGKRIAELESQARAKDDRETLLRNENKQLRTEVGRLKLRVKDLEDIFKIGPVPDDMRARLEEIDRKTSEGSDK